MVLLTIIALSSCKKDVHSLELDVTPVAVLKAPADKTDIKLDPLHGSNIVFQWDSSKTSDGGVILYEIAFDKVDGDFSKPVYKITSDGSGLQAQATISQKDMNKIASLGGIAASSSGTLKWTIFASKATNSVRSTAIRSITVERPAGFAVIPAALYITGTATEGGDDVTKAVQLRQISPGVFETYTSLKAGSYQLIDAPNASGTKYYVDANGAIQLGSSTTTVTGATKVYRLDFDLNVATTQSMEISTIGLWVSAYATEQTQLQYIGNGVFESPVVPIVFYQFSWGRDDRYKFVMHTAAGDEWLGSSAPNNDPPAGKPASYFFVTPVTNDQWNNTYKFDPAADNHKIKADIYFQATGDYYNKITYLN